MADGPLILVMGDGSAIHKGDKRKISATYSDDADVAATPTDASIEFIPPSGSGNKVVYAKNPTGAEQQLTMISANVGQVSHVFDEYGWWDIVAYGATNMDEVEPARVLVENVPS